MESIEERYTRLILQGKDPAYYDGQKRALDAIKKGVTSPDPWIVSHMLNLSYMQGYIGAFKALEG